MADSDAGPGLRFLLVTSPDAESATLTAALGSLLPALLRASARDRDEVARLAAGCDVVLLDLTTETDLVLRAVTLVRRTAPDRAVVVWVDESDGEAALAALSAGADEVVSAASSVPTAVQRALRRREVAHRHAHRAHQVLEAVEMPTCVVDGSGRIVEVNRAWRAFGLANGGDPARTGIGMGYLEVCRAATGVEAIDGERVAQGLLAVLSGTLHQFAYDYPCPSPQQERWFNLRVNALASGGGAVVTHVDVTAAKRTEHTLEYRSLHDPLTDLPNRTLLDDRLDRAFAAAARSRRPVGLAFLDLDDFKSVNDELGHAAGDELLQAVAARLSQHLRRGDTLARFAGDEFVVLWPSVQSEREAEHLAERLKAAFDVPFSLTAATISVSACLGVVVGAPPQAAEDLVLQADAAMYAAKSSGPGELRTYRREVSGAVATRRRLRDDVTRAMADDEFAVHYQPVVELDRGNVTGVEALLRWWHPDGLLLPAVFLPPLGSSEVLVPLGTWVLEQACREAGSWKAERASLQVGVNLAPQQVRHPDLLPTVERVLHASGLPPHRLLVEVHGATVTEDAAAVAALSSLAGLGVRIALDDFGTDRGSLHVLESCPVDVIKVDRSFVAGLGVVAHEEDIVTGIVRLAHAVGARCIANGVETREQYDVVRDLGCDGAQGFFIGRPAPVG